MTVFIAHTFRDLANDPSWPFMGKHNMAEAWKLTMARLVIMLVEANALNLAFTNHSFEWKRFKLDAVREMKINFDHYANVKDRVEEAGAKG